MGNYNYKVGGKTRAAVDRPPKIKQTGIIKIDCKNCGAELSTMVIKDVDNDIFIDCNCLSITHIKLSLDGVNAYLLSQTIDIPDQSW